jgi:hypothetical protein
MITLLEELRRQVKFSGAARALADAAIVRLAMSSQFSDLKDWLGRLEDGAASAEPAKKKVLTADQQPRESHPIPLADREPPVVVAAAAAPREMAVPARSAGAVERERAARDPLVQRILSAVEGTLGEVRTALKPVHASPATSDDPAPGEVDSGLESTDIIS